MADVQMKETKSIIDYLLQLITIKYVNKASCQQYYISSMNQ